MAIDKRRHELKLSLKAFRLHLNDRSVYVAGTDLDFYASKDCQHVSNPPNYFIYVFGATTTTTTSLELFK